MPQERYIDDPWGVVLCCLLMDRTEANLAVHAIDEIRNRWADWRSLRTEIGVHLNHEGQIDVKDEPAWRWLHDTLTPLGRPSTRLDRLLRWLLHFHVHGQPRTVQDILTLPHVTPFAVDCWRLLIDKDYTSPLASDNFMFEEYRAWHLKK